MSISKHQYTRTPKKRLIGGLIIAVLLWIGFGLIIWFVAPSNQWIEAAVIGFLVISVFWSGSLLGGKKKWGIIAGIGIIGALVLNRLGWLGWGTAGAGLIALGLLSLIN